MLSSSFKMQIQFRKEFMKIISERGHKIQLYSDLSVNEGEILSKEHHFKSFSYNLFYLLTDLIKLNKIIGRDIDLIINYTIRNCLLSSILVLLKLNRCRNVFFIAGLGRSYTKNNVLSSVIIKIISYAAIKNGNQVVVMNTRDYELFLSKNLKPIRINSEGIDSEEFRYIPVKSNNQYYNLVFLGRVIPEKGIYDLLRLADHFKHNKKVRIEIYGDISETPKDFLYQIKLHKNIHLMGFTNDPQKVISDAHMVVLPSTLNEGLPRIMLECFALGRICLAYDIPGCSDAYFFTPYPKEFLASSIFDLAEKCELVLSLSQKSYIQIAEKLSNSIVIHHTVSNINAQLLNEIGI